MSPPAGKAVNREDPVELYDPVVVVVVGRVGEAGCKVHFFHTHFVWHSLAPPG